jgi:hypothetical protein
MGARTKLNSAYVCGALTVAALAGGATGSWLIFGIVAVALVASSIYTREIRSKRGGGRNRRTPPRQPPS